MASVSTGASQLAPRPGFSMRTASAIRTSSPGATRRLPLRKTGSDAVAVTTRASASTGRRLSRTKSKTKGAATAAVRTAKTMSRRLVSVDMCRL
jgi:hypothetical protein